MYYGLKKITIVNKGDVPQEWYSNDFEASYLKYMHDTICSFLVRNGYVFKWTDSGISVTAPTWDSAVALELTLERLTVALELLDDLQNIDIPEDYKQAWDNAIEDIEDIETVEQGLHTLEDIHDKVIRMYAVVTEGRGMINTEWFDTLETANSHAHSSWFRFMTKSERRDHSIYVGTVHRGEYIDPDDEGWNSSDHGNDEDLQWWLD